MPHCCLLSTITSHGSRHSCSTLSDRDGRVWNNGTAGEVLRVCISVQGAARRPSATNPTTDATQPVQINGSSSFGNGSVFQKVQFSGLKILHGTWINEALLYNFTIFTPIQCHPRQCSTLIFSSLQFTSLYHNASCPLVAGTQILPIKN